jgi:hypothetical protein
MPLLVGYGLAQKGPVFELPVPVAFEFQDASSRTVVVQLRERATSQTVPIDRPLRRACVSAPDLAATVQPG